MSDKFKKRPSFTKEKAEILKKTLGQFDEEITVDPLSLDNRIDTSKDRTFLLHVLIETLCCILEKDEERRKKLFKSLHKSFEDNKEVVAYLEFRFEGGPMILYYTSINYVPLEGKTVHQSISPLPIEMYDDQETSIPISKIEKYSEAFDELEVIARGGFGTVCKARHKVDGLAYAVKKIIFEYRKDSDYVTGSKTRMSYRKTQEWVSKNSYQECLQVF